jgi:hypothetical protein
MSISKKTYRLILMGLKQSHHMHVTCTDLSQVIGIYPDVIQQALSIFHPMLMMDIDFNILPLTPMIEDFLKAPNKPKRKSSPSAKKQTKLSSTQAMDNFYDFMYEKMTIAGFYDKNLTLSEKDLKKARLLLNKLIKAQKK